MTIEADRTKGARTDHLGRRTLNEKDWVGRRLRQIYDQAMSEPLSPELEELARKLADKSRGTGGHAG